MVLHLDTSLAPHNFGRDMTATARALMFTPMFTPTLPAGGWNKDSGGLFIW
jgi:hypothetical protein